MRHIYEISNEGSPGTKENWYEVYEEQLNKPYGHPGRHVATIENRDNLAVYLHGLDRIRSLISKGEIDYVRCRCSNLSINRKDYNWKIFGLGCKGNEAFKSFRGKNEPNE